MLSWAITFLIIALIAAVLGFGGIAGSAAWIAQVLFGIFIILFLVSFLFRDVPHDPERVTKVALPGTETRRWH